MASLNTWVKAARLRTLPLAVSGILMGSTLSVIDNSFNLKVSLLAVATALFIQIFSNFANDYGDFENGTDNSKRIGPRRTVQAGEISPGQMVRGMVALAILSLGTGLWLVFEGTKGMSLGVPLAYIVLGALSLAAAFKYTAGKKPYGYAGFGDFAVFLFFGLLPVAGVYFLNTHHLYSLVFFPAISIGFFSSGVLNLNNMRDVENDRNSGKNTMVVRMGSVNAKIYHSLLIVGGMLSMVLFTSLHQKTVFQWLFLFSYPFFIIDLVRILRVSDPRQYDPFLKRLSVTTLFFTLLCCLGVIGF